MVFPFILCNLKFFLFWNNLRQEVANSTENFQMTFTQFLSDSILPNHCTSSMPEIALVWYCYLNYRPYLDFTTFTYTHCVCVSTHRDLCNNYHNQDMEPFHSQTLAPTWTLGNHWAVLHYYNFAIWRVLCKWDCTVCTFRNCLLFPTQCKIHPSYSVYQ